MIRASPPPTLLFSGFRFPLRLAVLTFVLWVAGCSGARDATDSLPDRFPNHSTAEILGRVSPAPDTLHAFKARANVLVSSPEERTSFGARISHRRADSLYMSIRAAFGIEAARALVTPDSFFVYDRLKKKLYFGDIEKGRALLPIPVFGEEVFGAMLGLLTHARPGAWVSYADSLHYRLEHDSGRWTLLVDPANWRITKFVERDLYGVVVEERRYSEFDRFQDILMPRRVTVNRPLDGAYASLYYSDLDLNPPDLDFEMRVSDATERIPVR